MPSVSGRLERQRPPARPHKRANYRDMVRGYEFAPHTNWGDLPAQGPRRAKAAPYSHYAADADIGAEDGTNAAELAAEGFVAVPTTNWTTGQYIRIGTFNFNWNGSAWAAGIHA